MARPDHDYYADRFFVTLTDELGAKHTHVATEVVLHLPGGEQKTIRKGDLLTSPGATLKERLAAG
jgi:hypothetical protein